MAKRNEDRLGKKYGRLVVTDSIYIRGLGTGWKCLCECGNQTYVSGSNLSRGNTTSCGCALTESRITHGKTGTRVYGSWKSMHRRCTSHKDIGYHNYGGRGIRVCARWRKFENFLEDMGEPKSNESLDRINNNGNYEPGNCRWANSKDQLNNRRNNRVLTAFGKIRTLTQWSEEYEIPMTTLRNRLDRAGLSLEQALLVQKRKD